MTRLQMLGRGLLVLGVGVVLTGRVVAHHSFAAEYDQNKPIRVKGVLTNTSLVNPHGWIHMDVTDDAANQRLVPAPAKGKTVNWAIETGAPNALYRRGWRPTDFPVGRVVIVEGYMAKDGSPTVNGACVTFEDGRRLFAGSTVPRDSFVGTGLEGGQSCGEPDKNDKGGPE
jgi:hypothetical protein